MNNSTMARRTELWIILTFVVLSFHLASNTPTGDVTKSSSPTIVDSNSNNNDNDNNNTDSDVNSDDDGDTSNSTFTDLDIPYDRNSSVSLNTTNSATEEPFRKCELEYSEDVRNSPFSQHHEVMEFHVMRHTIKPGQRSCYLTRSDLERRLRVDPEHDVIGAFVFQCQDPGTEIHFLENEEARELEGLESSEDVEDEDLEKFLNTTQQTQYRLHPRYIQYFQIGLCRIHMKAVWMVANMTELRVFTVVGERGLALSDLEDDPGLCEGFRDVVAFSIIGDFTVLDNLHYLTHCQGYMDNVVEMDFFNNSMTSFPEELHDVLPNLRALEFKWNNLTSPVEFPWPPGFAVLPRNLSRTYQFNTHYNFNGAFDMPPNLFRKVYSLDKNKIRNLTHFQFSGEFQYITVKENGLREISGDVFDRVPGVEYLSLAGNVLDEIPEDLFASLRNLKRLDLQGNNLTRLHDRTFKNLIRLETLHLEENRLEVLQKGLFTTLENLKAVFLEKNHLHTISDDAFSTMSVKLSRMDLQHNPLQEVPPIVFLLRGLKQINLEYTDIEVLDFAEIDRRSSIYVLVDALKNPTTGEVLDHDTTPDTQKVLSLRYGKLRSIVMYNATEETRTTFMLIIKHYTIQTESTRLACDCNILNVTHLLNEWKDAGRLKGTEACLAGWKCIWPDELSGKPIVDLEDEETYCPLEEIREMTSCPEDCTCYKRTGIHSVIVDCKNVGLTSLPEKVPDGTRELWLQNNTIEALDYRPYLQHVESLNLTSNHIKSLPVPVLRNMPELHSLDMKDNWMAGLDARFADLGQLQKVRLSGNPFRCDCHSLWMKSWLIRNRNLVSDWDAIKCSTDEAEGQTLTDLPDSQFVCKFSATLGQLAVPVAVPVAIFLPILALTVVAVLLRRRLKVLIYVHTGLHPFDRDLPDHHAKYDVTIVCDAGARAWVLRNIVEPLEHDYRYKVFFYCRDAYVGFSISENVRHCVRHSRRMAVVLGADWEKQDVLLTAVRQALDKSRKDLVQFMTVVLHHSSPKDIHDKDLRYYTRRGRYVGTDDKYFLKKLVYEMPHLKKKTKKKQKKNLKPNKDSSKSLEGGIFQGSLLEDKAALESIVFHDIVATAQKEQKELTEKDEVTVNNRVFVRQISGDSGIMDLKDNTERQDSYQQEQEEINDDVPELRINHHPGTEKLEGQKNEYVKSDTLAPAQNTYQQRQSDTIVNRLEALKQLERKSVVSLSVTPIYIRQTSQERYDPQRTPRSIFVWYGELDLAFTLKNIVEPLERLGHACVLQDRDFPLGAAIQENIVHAVQSCTRTVLVLSSCTSRDEWFTFAFHVAFDRHLQSREHRVALLKREDCDVTKFVEEVQQTITTSALLCEDDPWFWKRLLKFVEFDQVDIC